MVIGTAKILINTLLQYPLVTLSLYIPRSLGLNKKAADKTLTDSVLSVFLLADSNKTTPKAMKMPRFLVGAGQNKITKVADISS